MPARSPLFPFSCEGQDLFLNGNATLESWNISTGKQQWVKQLPAAASFRPRYGKNIVVSAGREMLAGYRRDNGSQAWRHKPSGELAVPLVSDGHVYIGEKSTLLALNLATGRERWSYPVSGNARVAYAPTESDGVLYFGPGDGARFLRPGRVNLSVPRGQFTDLSISAR